MSDTLMRQWQMLRLVPREPARISTSSLKDRLAEEGYETSQRTLQRDLVSLSGIYPLVCDEQSKPYGWSWFADAAVLDIPGMDVHTALAFHLAQAYLEPLLPAATVRHLTPHFDTAARLLDRMATDRGMPAWRNKVRVLTRGPDLAVPEIDSQIQKVVYDALLHNRCLDLTYNSRARAEVDDYEVHPLGIVLKDGLSYLVCTLWDYDDIRVLALHRVSAATIRSEAARIPDGFNLDEYIAGGAFNILQGTQIRLKLAVTAAVAQHLSERPLSKDQKSRMLPDGRTRISATVQDSMELQWWLLGFGDQVEVLAPAKLRKTFAETAERLGQMYAGKPFGKTGR